MATTLPAIPTVDGPLRLDLVYPPEGATVTARDSTFVFGSTGSGQTELRINGLPVDVAPNGAFLGYLPVPADGVYRLQASKNGATASAERRVRVPAPAPPPSGAQILPGSIYPSGALTVTRDENVEFGFRGPPGGRATLQLASGERYVMLQSGSVEELSDAANFQRSAARAAASPVVTYRVAIPVREPLVLADSAAPRPSVGSLQPRAVRVMQGGYPVSTIGPAEIEFVMAGDTARRTVPVNIALLDAEQPRVAVVRPPRDAPSDWAIRGRNAPSGPFHYFWPPETRLEITGERNAMLRVRLSAALSAWVPSADVLVLPEGTPVPRSGVDAARMTPYTDFIDLRIPLAQQLPFHVDADERALHLSVFGATSRINFFQQGALDPLIERAQWTQPADDVLRFSIQLTAPVWGYDVFHSGAGALILRVRRPPRIDRERPLHGLLVALDAGHPPGGAIGPTRLTEAEANLWIARKLQPMLEAAGARVMMTRTGESAVDLNLRPRMATDSSAHVLVSVHNNAFPDGVNPFENNGTSVYYFQPQSADMARAFQAELLRALGLRDLGVGRADLALVRPTWMPAVLTETSFLMVPQQEAALRNEEVQERIARAHLRALENFLRRRAGAAAN